ncbi:MAG: 2-amino-4-hydroxy-6-hydroxymethyldihydropteridine diphosphokinase [Deltaproteobacteria bacterium]|nr:2-amino-4-hydroxy-6-hydroxymethyldihydropteridine diphosphokinase [Deltaproteobacteria bacterium]
MKQVYLAFGSNIEPSRYYLTESLYLLKEMLNCPVICSSVYQTKAYLNEIQPDFLNCCVAFKTNKTALELLSITQSVENKIGGTKEKGKWADRKIDIDLVLYGNDIISLESLKVPHYDLSHRDFFLIPLLELDPLLINPKTSKSLREELRLIASGEKTDPRNVGSLSSGENRQKENDYQNPALF